MKKFLSLALIFVFACIACSNNNKTDGNKTDNNSPMPTDLKLQIIADEGYAFDSLTTPAGRPVSLVFIKHGSIIVDIDGYLVYIDPVTMFGNDFAALPKADMIVVTHEHHDHFDPKAIEELASDTTMLVASQRVVELYGEGRSTLPGDSIIIGSAGLEIAAVPAYNISLDHLQFHPKDRNDIGVVLNIDGLRIYVAGDTEDIPEMSDLKGVDIAFIPVNQPYTMTPEQAIHAVDMLKPNIVYPYHYGDTDLSPLVNKFAGMPTEVRIRQLQ